MEICLREAIKILLAYKNEIFLYALHFGFEIEHEDLTLFIVLFV